MSWSIIDTAKRERAGKSLVQTVGTIVPCNVEFTAEQLAIVQYLVETLYDVPCPKGAIVEVVTKDGNIIVKRSNA